MGFIKDPLANHRDATAIEADTGSFALLRDGPLLVRAALLALSTGCRSTDALSAICGNGLVDAGEARDDGTANADDADCSTATCGDGFIWAGHEVCDEETLAGPGYRPTSWGQEPRFGTLGLGYSSGASYERGVSVP